MNKKLKSLLSVVLAILLTLQLAPAIAQEAYANHWAAESIDLLVEKGIVVGDENGNINPDGTITRAEFVTLVNRTFGYTEESSENFPDVEQGKWYYSQFARAKQAGFIKGDEYGNATPDAYITRAEVAVILTAVLNLSASKSASEFSDDADIPAWALTSIIAMQENNLISGYPDGSVRAKNNLTRAEGFTLIANVINSGFQDIEAIEEDDTPLGDLPADVTIPGNNNSYYPPYTPVPPTPTPPDEDTFSLFSITDVAAGSSVNDLSLQVSASDACYLDILILSDVSEDIVAGRSTDWTGGNFLTAGQVYIDDPIEMEFVNIECDDDLPQNFVVIACLSDDEGNELCEPAVFIDFTDSHNKFEAQTVNDFDPDLVLNLDDDPTNNFMVLNPSVLKIVSGENDMNFITVTGVDAFNITVASDAVKALEAGDRLVAVMETAIYLIQVAEITVDGDDVAILSISVGEQNLDEFFDVIKLSLDNDDEVAGTWDASSADEGVVYLGDASKVDYDAESQKIQDSIDAQDTGAEITMLAEPAAMGIGIRPASDIDTNVSGSAGASFTIPIQLSPKLEASASISIKFSFTVKVEYDVRLFAEDYFEFRMSTKTDTTTLIKLAVEGDNKDKNSKEVNLGRIDIPLLGPVFTTSLTLKVPLEWDLSGSISVTNKNITEKGFKYTNIAGRQDIDKKETTTTYEVKAEGKLRIGPKVTFSGNLMGSDFFGTILSAGVEFFAGIELAGEAEYSGDIRDNASSTHDCDLCVDGNVSAVLKASIFLKTDIGIGPVRFKGTWVNITLAEARWKLSVFYFSILNASTSVHRGNPKFGLGSCPNKAFRVIITPRDANGSLVAGANVVVKNSSGTQMGSGTGSYKIYLPNGNYTANASAANMTFAEKDFRVQDNSLDIIINEEGVEANGTLRGDVKDAETNAAIPNATVRVYRGSTLSDTRTTDSNGSYEVSLPAGNYRVEITASDYRVFVAYVSIESNRVQYMETFLLITDEEGEGVATGTIKNAVSGAVISNVRLDVRNGWGNFEQGSIINTFYTNASGVYSITLPYGNYTLVASKDGYITDTINIIVKRTPSTKNSTLSPLADANEYRVVLTWGSTPSDLDSHLVASGVHVYYSRKNSTYAWLDIDDTSSYGPETITITNLAALGGFKYCIHDFTNRSSSSGAYQLSNSNAIVRVFRGAELIRTYFVPTERQGTVWNVFSISAGGQITDLNTFEYQSDAGSVGSSGVMATGASFSDELKDYEILE